MASRSRRSGLKPGEVLERDGLVIQQIEQVIVHFGAADIGHDTDALLVLAKPLLQLPELVGCLAGPGQQGRVGFGQLLHAALLHSGSLLRNSFQSDSFTGSMGDLLCRII